MSHLERKHWLLIFSLKQVKLGIETFTINDLIKAQITHGDPNVEEVVKMAKSEHR